MQRRSAALISSIALVVSAAACSGGARSTLPAAPQAPPLLEQSASLTLPLPDPAGAVITLPSVPVSGTVRLPAGSRIAPASLTAVDGLGRAPVGKTGAFTIRAFGGGPQLTMILDGSGRPVLLGWLGAGQTTIDANSTAQSLVYFAANCFLQTADVRSRAIALIPQAPGFAQVEAAVTAALVAGTDPLGKGNAGIKSALAALLAAASKAAGEGGRAHPLDVAISPLDGTSGSGIDVINDFPDGLHFINNYRRRAEAYIDRVSYVDAGGKLVDSPAQLLATPAPIEPVTGTNDGALHTFADIASGNYAWTPVTTEPIALALVPDSRKTTYLLTIVGPGLHDGAFDRIPPSEREASDSIATEFLVTDLVVPLIANVLVPANEHAIEHSLQFTGGESVVHDFTVALLKEAPEIAGEADAGEYGTALRNAVGAIVKSHTLTSFLQQKILDRVISSEGIDAQAQAFATFQNYNAVMQGVTYGLVAVDLTALGRDIASSNRADQWQVVVVPDVVKLLPANSKLGHARSRKLTVSVPADTGAEHVALGYSWSNTAKFGHLTDGLAGHTDTFASSRNAVTYTASDTGLGTDTITVSVESLRDGSEPPEPIGLPQKATVAVGPNEVPLIRLEPSTCVQFGASGGSQGYLATAIDAPKGVTLEYGWPLRGTTKLDHIIVPGAKINTFLQQQVGPSRRATLKIDPLKSQETGFNGAVSAFLYYLDNGQLHSFDGQVVDTFAFYAAGVVKCK